MDIASLPYSKLIGLSEDSVGGQRVISLRPTDSHRNHVGTVHAAVVFSVAEAASAQALLATFPDLADEAIAILRSTQVKYRKPATGLLHGSAAIDEQAATEFRSRFEKKGVALIAVSATVRQGALEILTGEFSWFVTRRD